MDKLLNSSFYLHLEKGPEFAKRFRILDVLDSKVKYEKEGKNVDFDSDELEIGIKEITDKWIDKIYKVTKTQTKTKLDYDKSYLFKGMKDSLTIKCNQIMISLCGHVHDDKVKKVFEGYSNEVFAFIYKKI